MKVFKKNGDLTFSFVAWFWLIPAVPLAIFLSWALLSQYSKGALDGFATVVGLVIIWGYVGFYCLRLIAEIWAFQRAQAIIRAWAKRNLRDR